MTADHPFDPCRESGCCHPDDPDAVCARCDLPKSQHPEQER